MQKSDYGLMYCGDRIVCGTSDRRLL